MRSAYKTINLIIILAVAVCTIAAFSSCSSHSESQVDNTAASSPSENIIVQEPTPTLAQTDTPATATPNSSNIGKEDVAPTLSVLFINVGRADSTLVSYGDFHYLIDTGTADTLPTLIKTLSAMNVDTLDGVFITHPHKDHIGGLFGLLSLVEVDRIYMPQITDFDKDGSNDVIDIAAQFAKELIRLSSGDEIPLALGDAVFKIIGPISHNSDKENNNSLVMQLVFDQTSFLFTGDMQFAEETSLLPLLSPCDVLKVGHHGKSDATSIEFVNAVQPKIAVITSDNLNLDTLAVQTLRTFGADIYFTIETNMGQEVISNGKSLSIVNRTFLNETFASGIKIDSIDTHAELLTIINSSPTDIDLSGWWLYSEKGNEVFFFPSATVIASGQLLTIASDDFLLDADLYWHEKNVYSDDKQDSAVLYDQNGNAVSSLNTKP